MGKPAVDWDGVMPAIITPFDRQGRIDEDAFCRFVDINVDWGVTGIVVTGCSGESWAMTNDERKRVYKLAVDAARGRIRVLASTSAVRVEDVIELSAYASDIGCEGSFPGCTRRKTSSFISRRSPTPSTCRSCSITCPAIT